MKYLLLLVLLGCAPEGVTKPRGQSQYRFGSHEQVKVDRFGRDDVYRTQNKEVVCYFRRDLRGGGIWCYKKKESK